jgi:hypothetical protein
VSVALEVPATGSGWLSNELSCSPGSLLAVATIILQNTGIAPQQVE